MAIALLILFSFMCAWFATGVQRVAAINKKLLAVPNARSSHSIPTPTGGGGAFSSVFCIALLGLFLCDKISATLFVVFCIGGGGIALIGMVDDKYDLAARHRLCVHFMASGLAQCLIKGPASLSLFGLSLHSPALLNLFLLFYLVWLLNLYNFMDGIDGIAGVEAVTVCIVMTVIYHIVGLPNAMLLPLLLAAVVLGFLWWNMPHARIFMGDVGSGFLGFLLGVFSLQAASYGPQYFWAWVIMLGVFICDASLTLLTRALAKKKLSEAHCSHAYQHAAKRYQSHFKVTLSVALINLLWLAPWAFLVSTQRISPSIGVLVSYSFLSALGLRYRSGKE